MGPIHIGAVSRCDGNIDSFVGEWRCEMSGVLGDVGDGNLIENGVSSGTHV